MNTCPLTQRECRMHDVTYNRLNICKFFKPYKFMSRVKVCPEEERKEDVKGI